MLKNCFIIMGFNTKTMDDGKEYNLNLSYQRIIKPILDKLKIDYVRADEIMVSEIIDESMYRLLLCADLVIADLTTLNPNALYELGVRYALKPASTILMASNGTKFPFDINHLRIFTYAHLGNDIEKHECARMQEKLIALIKNISNANMPVDSPVYKYINGLIPPYCPSDSDYFSAVSQRFKASDNLCSLVNAAYRKRDAGDFSAAIRNYKKALQISKDEYIIKEIAVCIYQQGTPQSFLDALQFLKGQVDINKTSNPEILKALGTIYKNLWFFYKIEEYAKQALIYYEKSFVLYSSYNSGLNYGFMLYVMATYQADSQGRDSFKLWGKQIYRRTREVCLSNYALEEYWVNASLEECAFALGNHDEYEKYKQLAETAISFMPPAMTWKRKKTTAQIEMLRLLITQISD